MACRCWRLCVEGTLGFSAFWSPADMSGGPHPGWASIPCDTGQFIQLHALPWDDHPSNLVRTLLSEVPSLGGGWLAPIPSVAADTSTALEKGLEPKSCQTERQFQTPFNGSTPVVTDLSIRRKKSFHIIAWNSYPESPQRNVSIKDGHRCLQRNQKPAGSFYWGEGVLACANWA